MISFSGHIDAIRRGNTKEEPIDYYRMKLSDSKLYEKLFLSEGELSLYFTTVPTLLADQEATFTVTMDFPNGTSYSKKISKKFPDLETMKQMGDTHKK